MSLVVAGDRLSNSPHLYYPAPHAAGGVGEHEDCTVDNFMIGDPNTGQSMLQTAENVAERWRIDTMAQHDLMLMRYDQYQNALANQHAFQARYMKLPFDVPDDRFGKVVDTIEGDTGIYPVTPEGLAKLKPVIKGGTVTYAGQTHPADAAGGILVSNTEMATEVSQDRSVKVTIEGCSHARVEPGYMPSAPVPATEKLLRQCNIKISDVDMIKTHNPFAVNDIVFHKETGYPLEKMNDYGCSLIFGHPHSVTPIRQIIELIEILVERGGGLGVYNGCAAGDVGIAVLIKVDNR